MALHPGQVLTHYRLIEKIGEGGMGLVWKAIDTSLDREVALKFLPDGFIHDPARLSRFEKEAKAVAALNHPNIVTIHSVDEVAGTRFLALELVQGATLAEIIPPGGLGVAKLLDIAVAVADALGAAHGRGVTHRDLKPSNIMVSREGRVKVLDFGLAGPASRGPLPRSSDVSTRSRSGQGRISGTLPYMSPEQVRGRPVDHRSDIFSLGIVIHEMATGERPFTGDTAADLIASILKDAPLPLASLRGDAPAALERIVLRCLEKEAERRPQSVLEIRDELEEARAGLRAATEEALTSIAILPFSDLSPALDQDYFCDGITEEITSALATIRGLHVAPRTSSFRFRSAEIGSREIGRRLRVSTLLEGSVRKEGDHLRVTVRLIDASRGSLLWSGSYDRRAEDIFAIQQEIAQSVVKTLRLELTPGERDALQKAHTIHVQAYDRYLKGRKYYFQYRRKGIEFALQMFHRAIDLDPAYALAHAGISDCCAFLYLYAGREGRYMLGADEASARALELDPRLAQAHASRGVALTLGDRQDEAEGCFEVAIHIDPGLFEGWYFYARACFARGLLEKAARLFEKAAEVRPEDYQSPLLVAQIYDRLGRTFAAEAARRRGLKLAEERVELNPDDSRALYMAANAMVALGMKARGLEWCRRALELDPGEPMLLYNVACIQSLAGDVDSALQSLESCVEGGLAQREWFQMDSNLDPIRDQPRFLALMERLSVKA